MITPQNALKLSMWLAINHPAAFQAVLNQTVPVTQHRLRMGLGSAPLQGAYIPGARNRDAPRRGVPPGLARGRFGRFADVWSDINAGTYDASALRNSGPIEDSSTVTVTADAPGVSFGADPTLQDINLDMPSAAGTFDLGSAAAASDTSGGFWSSIGSGLSSVGSGLASAVGSVAGAFLNPQTLASAGNLAATVIKANGANAQQQAILQAQVQRTATGAGVQPIRYAVNPATGQQVPMYYNATTGQYQPTAAGGGLFGSLFTPSVPGAPSTVGTYLPYILIGGGVLLIAAVALRK